MLRALEINLQGAVMRKIWGAAAIAAVMLSGCATKGVWMGAEAEKAYDKDLDVQRLAAILNNDDYYEIHQDGRIYVISDAKDYKAWLKTGEMPLAVTKFGAGPNGEMVKMSLTKNETKGMEKKAGFRGGAQNLYEGTVDGLNKNFFGFVMNHDHYYVFNDWKQLSAFRKTGQIGGESTSGTAPDGKPVTYAVKSEEIEKRFRELNAP
jgi:hypothetical protein